ncbi:hypothetical protein ACVOMV_32385 [Mesorhizobium atlanticum]
MMDLGTDCSRRAPDAGYASPSDAARALREINKNTLISHARTGNRPLSRKAAEKYGRLFGVDPGWLLFNGSLGAMARKRRLCTLPRRPSP